MTGPWAVRRRHELLRRRLQNAMLNHVHVFSRNPNRNGVGPTGTHSPFRTGFRHTSRSDETVSARPRKSAGEVCPKSSEIVTRGRLAFSFLCLRVGSRNETTVGNDYSLTYSRTFCRYFTARPERIPCVAPASA